MALSSGTKLGPYEIQSPLGSGGMGEVYRARDTRLDRTVAVKILSAHLSSDSDRARFEREARSISALNHPNICQLYDVGTHAGIHYLVMEYVEGESLADRLRKGPLSRKQVLEFGAQIAQALATAHRAGILHRDLKPGNVMMTANGAKLMDFGLAKPVPALTPAGSAAISGMTPSTPTMSLAALTSAPQALTQQGTVVGTFQYMAPEILQGQDADARSDVFSLGCVLFEMATGRRAFEGKSQLSVLTAILEHDPDPVSRSQPSSPPALDHVVKSCLEKNPEERLQTAQDVKLQLKWIADTGALAAGPQSARTVSRIGWLPAAAVAALLVLSLAAAYWLFAPPPAPVVQSSILPPPGTSFTTVSGSAGPPVLSPDGTKLAFTARDEKGKTLLYMRPLISSAAAPLAGTDDATYPFWSPDSREIGFFAGGKLKKIVATGGPPQIVCDVATGRGGSWSKDGVIVFASGPTQPIWRVSADGGVAEVASKFDPVIGHNSHRWPQFLPDGKHFLYWARSSRGFQDHAVYVGTLGSLDAKQLMKTEQRALYASGYLLYLRQQTLMAQPFDAGRREFTGAATPIAEHVAINSGTYHPIFSASETGTLIYQAGGTEGGWRLLWVTRNGQPGNAVGGVDLYFDPALSPDGKRLAAGLMTNQGNGDIWIFDLSRGTKTRLTFGSGNQRLSLWSPDGKTVFYASNRKGAFHIYAKAADGTGADQVILESNDAEELPDSITPDQRYLLYTRTAKDQQGHAEIWALPLFGDRKPFLVLRTEASEMLSAVSPNGKWIAYQSNESGRFEIYITSFPGGGAKWQVSNGGGAFAHWRRDGKELFFLDGEDNLMAVEVNTSGNTVRAGTPQTLFHNSVLQRPQGPYSAAADGTKFLVNSGDVREQTQPFTLVQNWQSLLKK